MSGVIIPLGMSPTSRRGERVVSVPRESGRGDGLALYTTALSANGRKPLALCRHLGLSPAVHTVNVYTGEGRSPEYLRIEPSGKIPVLVDGDLVLSESNAILVYLSEAHGGFRLWSRDPRRRAEIARWLFWEASAWQPVLIAILADVVAARLFGRQPVGPVRWGDAPFRAAAATLERALAAHRFVAGDELTLADLAVAGMMTYARAARFPVDDWPATAAWYARIEALEAWRATAEGRWHD
jgi:glutathione S-transferase